MPVALDPRGARALTNREISRLLCAMLNGIAVVEPETTVEFHEMLELSRQLLDVETSGATRAAGLRRLSRLTWRATQLSAVTAVGFATLFARTAPAQTADQASTAPSTEPSASASSAGTPAPSANQRHHPVGRKTAPGVQPTARAGQAATPSGGSSGSGSSPSSPSSSSAAGGSGSRSSSPSPTLAPPSSAPAPAPSTSSAPAPKPTVSSTSHAGG